MISRAITVLQTMEPTVVSGEMPVEGWTSQDAAVKIGGVTRAPCAEWGRTRG
jgi:hypothetical protein